MSSNTEYLIIGNDDEYDEPVGIFSGNLIDILHSQFLYKTQHELPDTTFTIYRLDTLRKDAKERVIDKSYVPKKHIEINAIDSKFLNQDQNKEFIENEIKEFNTTNPNIRVIVQKNGYIKFIDPNQKIQDEISKLSPETIEYIKANGI